MLKYYVTITKGVVIENPFDIPLHLYMQFRCQSISNSVQLEISFGENDNKHPNIFRHVFQVYGIYFDNFTSKPCRRAKIWLIGKKEHLVMKSDLYAFLDLDLANPQFGNSIIFSPVPFGADGKPQLLFQKDEQAKTLFCVAGCILDRTKPMTWNAEEVATSVCRLHIDMIWFLEEQASTCLKWLERLQVIERVSDENDGTYKPIMDAKQFQDIFGVKLPEVDPG